jgi:hypothetical protein
MKAEIQEETELWKEVGGIQEPKLCSVQITDHLWMERRVGGVKGHYGTCYQMALLPNTSSSLFCLLAESQISFWKVMDLVENIHCSTHCIISSKRPKQQSTRFNLHTKHFSVRETANTYLFPLSYFPSFMPSVEPE